jgi:DMSO reductase anchor subunit
MPVPKALLISTTFQRFSLGTFLCCFIATKFMGLSLPMNVIALITLICLGVGGIASAFHLGRPKRFFNAFANLGSHLTQEALITPFLGIALLACSVDHWLINIGPAIDIIYWIAVLLALLFLISTGLVYHLSSRPAWNTYLVLIVFLLTAAEAGAITTLAIALSYGLAVSAGLSFLAILAYALCLVFQLAFLNRLKTVGYGVDVFVTHEPYKTMFVFWLIFGLVLAGIALIFAVALNSAIFAYVSVIAAVAGIVFWTVLFFNVGLKVKMFPMYTVDLNLNM